MGTRRAAVASIAVVVALGACGEEAAPRAAASAPSPTPSPLPATATPTPPPATPRPLPDPVEVPPLPESGLALGRGRGVLLLDLSGNVVHELPGFEIHGNPGAPGVWLRRGPGFFRLHAVRGLLVPLSRRRASRSYDEGEPPRLRPPPGAWTKGIGISGHWRYAHQRDDGVLLAQWSDECEVPSSFWKAPGARPVVVTGEPDYADAPESVGVGWSPEGRAIVLLGEGLCGNSGTPPGLYAFAAPGAGELLFETSGVQRADMWP